MLKRFFRRRRPNIFLIEDNSMFRLSMEMIISRKYEMNLFDFVSYEDCMAHAEEKPDIVILDHSLPGINGLEAIPYMKEKWPGVQIIVVSSLKDTSTALQIFKTGICDYIEKNNYSAEELFKSLHKAMDALHIRVPLKKPGKTRSYTFGAN